MMLITKSLHIHPTLQNLLPALSESEYNGLEADILKNGVIAPLATWNDILIDGHHRYAICQKHNLPFETVAMSFDSLDAAKLWTWQHQDNRRNLTPCQRTEIALQFKPILVDKAQKNKSASGGDHKSPKSKSVLPISGESVTEGFRVDKELAKVAKVSHDTMYKAEFLNEHADESTKQKLRQGDTTINAEYKRLKTEQNRKEREEQKQADVLIANDDRIDLHVAPMAEAASRVEAESVDFIVTDPPYPKEYLGVYEDLATFALHALKPGGSLLCMVGQSYLPEIIATLAAKLKYHWTLAYLTPGGQATQLWERKINTFWKPILWFTKGKYAGDWIGDVAGSKTNDNDKRHHHWGQSESGMCDLMERFLYPNMTVCDPCLGGGTTGVCALRLGCRFLGLDIDPACIEKSQRRLATVLQDEETQHDS
jgi:site-specific DNA-methyltransferase (adenine-specific)